MHLAFDIFQGIGVAAALGIRPFLPALAAGALASGDAEIHFDHTDFAFLQSAPFLLAMAVCAIALAVVERRAPERLERGVGAVVLAAASLALGALFFAASLSRGHYTVWPGIVGGVLCALVGIAASRPLLGRARTRLGDDASLLPVFAEGSALLIAVLSIVAPPVGPIALVLLLWLLLAGRRREGQKYAGLRILR